jgi:hypothetical protein
LLDRKMKNVLLPPWELQKQSFDVQVLHGQLLKSSHDTRLDRVRETPMFPLLVLERIVPFVELPIEYVLNSVKSFFVSLAEVVCTGKQRWRNVPEGMHGMPWASSGPVLRHVGTTTAVHEKRQR